MWGNDDDNDTLTPTFEDLAIDPEMDDVTRLERFCTGSVELQRLVHVMMLSDTAQMAGFKTAKARLFPLAKRICRDQEFVVRQNLAVQLSAMCQFCHEEGTPDAYKAMIGILLPNFRVLVADNVDEVREAASIHLIKSAAFVREEDLMEHVLSIVLELAHDESDENLRVTAAGLMNGLSPRFGPELCVQFVVAELVSLSQDPNFKVRKAVALSMDKIMRVAQSCHTRLLPAYERLSKDSIWGVRKACADSLALLAESLDESVRVQRLLPLMRRFVRDNSKWVRGALSQRLGRFIASLPDDQITDEVLDLYLGMTDIHSSTCWINSNLPANEAGSNNSGGLANAHYTLAAPMGGTRGGPPEGVLVGGQNAPNDFANNIMYCCAYSFPAVVLKAGAARWGKLQPAFYTLINCDNQLVRRVMAYSLHELAQILGPAYTEDDLFPVFMTFLRDVEQVKTGVLLSIAKLFACLPERSRESRVQILIDVFDESSARNRSASMTIHELTANAMGAVAPGPVANLTGSTNRWRFRRIIASTLADFVTILSVQTVFSYIVPLGMKLLHDDVHEVREAAQDMVGPCLRRLREADENNNYQTYQDLLLRLARGSYFADRQHYIWICTKLALSYDFCSELTPVLVDPFVAMASDAVPNVRLAYARALQDILMSSNTPPPPSLDNATDAEDNQKEDDITDNVAITASKEAINSSVAGDGSTEKKLLERFPSLLLSLDTLVRDGDREVVRTAQNIRTLVLS
mmetsp:Transcript_17399/g.34167  ORF Transcript_17399/g.34167 Transcript_17399/m.34167 type:complete len:747 (+) Transcript_17399:860-3100(+)|eukprot:CAMPEP_0171491742 /NCGR_PEP_ID=MMETSP0958-20121227/4023_1 /TAXON_ID=87120 /ORGANISM="Aurantiochytrium limacinum, Strain ATCCMYA-1381" /LENGTH=746 /DNA_ID=CAMNT_0012025183 /DNA_START=677 /DNA_END=2917 /DNA_ORIENTATION=-